MADEDVEITEFVLTSVKNPSARLDIVSAITGATIDRNIEGDFTLTVDCSDPEKTLLRHPIFDRRVDDRLDPIDVRVDDVWFRLQQISRQGDSTSFTFEHRSIVYLKEHRGPIKWKDAKHGQVSRSKYTRAEFILRLVREVKTTNIGFYSPELHKKQPIAKPEEEKTHQKRRPSSKGKGESMGKFVSTAYGPPWGGIQGKGVTAGGTDLRDGKRRYIVAADPSVLKLGTHVFIDPNPYDYDGTFLVDDKGGAIKGKRIDFFVVEGRSKQRAWGRKEVTVEKADKAHKGTAHHTVDKQFTFSRGTPGSPENSWQAIQRLAGDVNWRAFIDENVLVYMSEVDLFRAAPIANIADDAEEVLSIEWEWDEGKPVAEATVNLFAHRWSYPPGSVVLLLNEGAATGKWIVESVSRSLFDKSAELTLRQPLRERKEPAHDESTVNDPSGGDVSGTPKHIIDTIVLPMARKHGIKVTAASVDTANNAHGPTHGGGRSDHQGPPNVAWAADMSNGTSPTKEMDALAKDLADRFDITWHGSGIANNTSNGYRFQLIYRINTPQAGNHYNHVHFGVRKVRS